MYKPSTPRVTDHGIDRRRFLCLSAAGLTVVTAGCASDGTGADDPVEAVERYFEALADGDHEAANQYVHEAGDYHVDEGAVALGAEISLPEPEEVTLETAVENKFEDPGDAEAAIEEERAAIETLQEEHGFEDYAYVRHEAQAEDMDLTFNPTFLLFESEAGWVIWSLPTAPPLQVEDL